MVTFVASRAGSQLSCIIQVSSSLGPAEGDAFVVVAAPWLLCHLYLVRVTQLACLFVCLAHLSFWGLQS